MPSFEIKTIQAYELFYLVEADSYEEAVEKIKPSNDYYQKPMDEHVVRVRKTKASKEKFAKKMFKKDFF